MEGFLQFLREQYPDMDLPKEVTKENVNNNLALAIFEFSFLQLAIKHKKFEVARLLIELGASSTPVCVSYITDLETAENFVDCGFDLSSCNFIHYIGKDDQIGYYMFDNGGNYFPEMRFLYRLDGTIDKFQKYYDTQVLPRISSCRQALLALLWCCTQSSSHVKGPFGALSNMMIQMATQVWCMRGGEGCGARAHGWDLRIKL